MVVGPRTYHRVGGMLHLAAHGSVPCHRDARGRHGGYDHLYMDDREVSFVGSTATFFVTAPSESEHDRVRACKRGWVADHRSRRLRSDSELSLHTLIGKIGGLWA